MNKKDLEEIKNKFESRNYIALIKRDNLVWMTIALRPAFNLDREYKLIHKKHEAVLNAWLLDSSIEIEQKYSENGYDTWEDCTKDNFIVNYREWNTYRLKEKKHTCDNFDMSEQDDCKICNKELRQYIKEAVNSNHPVKEVTSLIAMVKDEQKVNEFSKWGFLEPTYDYEILKELSDFIIVLNITNTDVIVISKKSGIAFNDNHCPNSEYKLTPIKKEWHDDINNFPALCKRKNTDVLIVIDCILRERAYTSIEDVSYEISSLEFIESLAGKLKD